MSEDSGSAAADASGNGITGTYRGGIGFESSGFTHDDPGAVSLNGTGGYVHTGDVFDFPENEAFSIELWLYPSGEDSAYRRIVSKEGSAGSGYSVWLQPDEAVSFQRRAGNRFQMVRFASLPPAQWSHVVGTYDGARLRL
ncbi:MAG: LamG domain-containing protein, partial [Actinomycetota bacterium]|nr:LamG domain-containing protein [Actinomycetota bacterium]